MLFTFLILQTIALLLTEGGHCTLLVIHDDRLRLKIYLLTYNANERKMLAFLFQGFEAYVGVLLLKTAVVGVVSEWQVRTICSHQLKISNINLVI